MDIEKLLNDLLEKFKDNILNAIKIDYSIGSSIGLHNIKLSGKKTTIKPLNMTKKEQEVNINIINDLVKGINHETAKKINYLTNKNITERGSNQDLAKALNGIFDKKSPNYFNYKNRMKTIARTESARIMSNSSYNTSKRLGFTHKYIHIVTDNRTAEQSKMFYQKYGSPDQAIPIDEEFSITYNGKVYSGLYSPFMPNDRDTILYDIK